MSTLTDDQYTEYLQVLKKWIEADKALKGPATPDAEAQGRPDGRASARARAAYAAVQGFRERYGLDGHERALERSAREAG